MRIVVAMSGGVDSSVAAGLMVEAGHEVVGLTMKLRDATATEREGRAEGSCCSPDDLRDAASVCEALGIPHYVVDYRDAFRKAVMEPFARAYLDGQTPNPCVLCNDHLKFAALVTRSKALGAAQLVTGHYARVVETASGSHELRAAFDTRKDQSYFLFGLTQKALAFTRFPLGEMSKDDVRATALRLGLPTWDKPDSEDICFVPDGDYARVVTEILTEIGEPRRPSRGALIDESGRVIGQHDGVHRFTVGQRKGVGASSEGRRYVLGVDAATGTINVGPPERLMASGLVARDAHFISGRAPGPDDVVTARIRYRHVGEAATVRVDGPHLDVRFLSPVRAITPGQAVVFTDGDLVLGGAWIVRSQELEQGADAVSPAASHS